jgi:hypothetical protein
LTPVIINDPTKQKNHALINPILTPQPFFPTTVGQRTSPSLTVPELQRPNICSNITDISTLPVTIIDDPDDSESMDIQVERKRRREEENKNRTELDNNVQHFLSAGPGSQDCREQ